MIKVKVPATSANLGPGFDVLGISLDLHNIFCFEEADEFSEDNLIMEAYKKTFELYGKEPIKVKISQDPVSMVPMAGGLGSSSTCIVAGVVCALMMMGLDFDRREVLRISNIIEGHPDNVGPAIYGSLIASLVDNEQIYFKRYELAENLKFIAIVPDFSVRTSDARAVLAKTIPLADGISNVARILFLIDGLESGDMDRLRLGLVDKFHQDYRKKLIRGYDQISDFAKKNGLGFFISGAGATLMLVEDKNDPKEDQLRDFIKENFPTYQILDLEIDKKGYQVL